MNKYDSCPWYRSQSVLILLASGLAVVIYFNSSFNWYVSDDSLLVAGNLRLGDWSLLLDAFTFDFWASWSDKPLGTASNYYRPLVVALLMLWHAVFAQSPFWYHFMNILMHALSVAVFFLCCRHVFERIESTAHSAVPAAFIAAVIFASHPINTESVAWISGISDVSMALFALSSFYLYVSGESARRVGLSAVFLFLAMLCKEPAMMMLPVMFVYDFAFRKDIRTKARLGAYAVFSGFFAVYMVMRFSALGGFTSRSGGVGVSAYETFLNACVLFWKYMGKLLYPFDLRFYYSYSKYVSINEPAALISVFLSVMLFAVAVYLLLRRSKALLPLSFLVMPLAPALYLPGLSGNKFYEHYLYMPCIGFAFFVAWAAAAFLVKGNDGSRFCRKNIVAAAAIAALVAAYSVNTVRMTLAWESDLTLLLNVYKYNKQDCRIADNVMARYLDEKGVDAALNFYDKVTSNAPHCAGKMFNLGVAYMNKSMYKEAEGFFFDIYQKNRSDAKIAYLSAYNLAFIYVKTGNYARAVEILKRLRAADPDYYPLQKLLYVAEFELKRRGGKAVKR